MGFKTLWAKVSLSRMASRVCSVPLSLPLQLTGRPLLVLLPEGQRDLTVVKQVLPDIIRLFGEDAVHLLAPPESEIESIFPSKGIKIISPGRNAVNWCGLPTRPFLDRLRGQRFDYLFDTNLDDNPFASCVLLQFPTAVRFGPAGRLGLPYLNLEIKTRYLRDRGLVYQCILEVMEHLSQNTGTLTS